MAGGSSTTPPQADVAVVNTCGFVEQAKKDSIDALLEASDLKAQGGRTQKVVAVGCLAERYGEQLADQLPEADAVLGFDSYRDLSAHLQTILAGGHVPSHTPGDRRRLLPLTPAAGRQSQAANVATPGHGEIAQGDGEGAGRPPGLLADAVDEGLLGAGVSGPRVIRARLDGRPWAPLKIASGCDRRCSFCAIPMFRGAFVSRRPADVIAEGRWLAERGVKELFLVSENSTSYGKDLGDLGLLEKLLPELTAIEGIARVRVSYLQPAEIRPGLLRAMADTPGVVPYYDISFQHASESLLRSMRRFGSREAFSTCSPRCGPMRPRPASGATSSSGSPVRPRPTSTSWRPSSPRPASMSSACSATPTKTAPRPSRTPPSSRRRSSPTGSTASRASSRSSSPNAPRSASVSRWRCSSRRSTSTS